MNRRLSLHARPAIQLGADCRRNLAGGKEETPGGAEARLNGLSLRVRPAVLHGANRGIELAGEPVDAPGRANIPDETAERLAGSRKRGPMPMHSLLGALALPLNRRACMQFQPVGKGRGPTGKSSAGTEKNPTDARGYFPRTLPPNSAANFYHTKRRGETDAACGLYVHVPFCDGKCPYCDFYSVRGTEERMEEYTNRIINDIKYESERTGRTADTLYFGGGTPSLLGEKRLIRIVEAARKGFGLEHAEITVEANPAENLSGFFREIRAAGVNRLSLGLQSADDAELRLLGRRHTAEQAARCIADAHAAGFENLSLDLMLAVQGQTEQSLRRSIAFCARTGAAHVSAYLLKVEPGTAYFKNKESLRLPDEDEAAALYLMACGELEQNGFRQYEISNFAKTGFQSRHNLKYWRDEEYLGFGPAAHSFLDGSRFCRKRSIGAFLRGEPPEPQGEGGGFEEFAMLALRLTEGLTDARCLKRFGFPVPERMKAAAKRYEPAGLTVCGADGFHFTPRGFLVSNALTAEILFAPQ